MENKKILKQYDSILKEIQAEEKRIGELQKEINQMRPKIQEVRDVVSKGKRGKKSLGHLTIHGFQDYKRINQKRSLLRTRKARKELHIAQLEMMVIDVEAYIYELPESEIRNILLYYCIDRMTWEETAAAMGEGYTAENCRQKYSRFVRKT